jgi:DNA-directed RNA polymerase subunit RPC12/RpoP
MRLDADRLVIFAREQAMKVYCGTCSNCGAEVISIFGDDAGETERDISIDCGGCGTHMDLVQKPDPDLEAVPGPADPVQLVELKPAQDDIHPSDAAIDTSEIHEVTPEWFDKATLQEPAPTPFQPAIPSSSETTVMPPGPLHAGVVGGQFVVGVQPEMPLTTEALPAADVPPVSE